MSNFKDDKLMAVRAFLLLGRGIDMRIALVSNNEERLRLIELKERLLRFLSAIENNDIWTACKMYYIDGLQWKEIAKKMNYSETQIRRYHKRGLRRLYGEMMKHDTK